MELGGLLEITRASGWWDSLAQFLMNCLSAELQALIKGLSLAAQLRLQPLQVEIDAKEVITLLDNQNSRYSNLIMDCRYLLETLHDPVVTHAYREQNCVADNPAKLGSRMPHAAGLCIFAEPPFCVTKQLLEERRGFTSQRMVPPTAVQQLGDQDGNRCFVTNHVPKETASIYFESFSRKHAVHTTLQDRQCDITRGDTSHSYACTDSISNSIANTSTCNMIKKSAGSRSEVCYISKLDLSYLQNKMDRRNICQFLLFHWLDI
ncbi:hypothetical protein A4A49_51650 [Nicotiana attenuata]|uniref:RNase H type-1 domain-containing protein n=1 Tax=Nicotiana attenuata TaxID=49451 RepID=A0A1J6IFN9_NICAT|nr:hypothetical protein A4A49_51650 [Nicotiana attenuata]